MIGVVIAELYLDPGDAPVEWVAAPLEIIADWRPGFIPDSGVGIGGEMIKGERLKERVVGETMLAVFIYLPPLLAFDIFGAGGDSPLCMNTFRQRLADGYIVGNCYL